MLPRLIVVVFFQLLLFSGCVSQTSIKDQRPLDYPFFKVFPATYDQVWDATVRVLDIYNIARANREAGLLQTEPADYRNNPDLFEDPDRNPKLEEVRYRLKIKLSKAYIQETQEPAVRVQVVKELSKYTNIFSDWERVPTDQLEEKVILYRIGKRLEITRALQKKTLGSKEIK